VTRFRFVEQEKASHPVRMLCSALGVSPSGYYAWRSRGPSARERSDAELSEKIRRSHARSRGTYGVPRVHADLTEAGHSVKKCFEHLANSADAIYVTQQGGVNRDTLPALVEIANTRNVATFSQLGSREVQAGFLLSISRPSFKPVGMFLAATLAQIMNGAKPGKLEQVFEETPKIAINLKTAEIIGLYLHADLLAAADEIYRDITPLK